MKVCGKCKINKADSDFCKNLSRGDGLNFQCRKCAKKYKDRYRDVLRAKEIIWEKTPDGVTCRMYNHQKSASKNRGHSPPNYNLEEFRRWVYSQDNWDELYHYWVKNNYNKCYVPSADRIDNNKPYTFNNMTLMTWRDNDIRANKDMRDGLLINKTNPQTPVIGKNIKTGEEIYFHSQSEAGRNGFAQTSVGLCARGGQEKHRGYTWRFA